MTDGGTEIDAAFDFRHTGAPTWEITIATDRGTLCLADYGNMLIVDGKQIATGKTEAEYPSLYRRFAELIQQHEFRRRQATAPAHCRHLPGRQSKGGGAFRSPLSGPASHHHSQAREVRQIDGAARRCAGEGAIFFAQSPLAAFSFRIV